MFTPMPPLDPTNSTVFIGNLVLRDEAEIRRVFDAYGKKHEVRNTK
jgi:hypothetical protein